MNPSSCSLTTRTPPSGSNTRKPRAKRALRLESSAHSRPCQTPAIGPMKPVGSGMKMELLSIAAHAVALRMHVDLRRHQREVHVGPRFLAAQRDEQMLAQPRAERDIVGARRELVRGGGIAGVEAAVLPDAVGRDHELWIKQRRRIGNPLLRRDRRRQRGENNRRECTTPAHHHPVPAPKIAGATIPQAYLYIFSLHPVGVFFTLHNR